MNQKEKAKQSHGPALALAALPAQLKAWAGKPGELREGSALKATLRGET